jgi:ribosome assembly protein RRB1
MPQKTNIVASWSDKPGVFVWDIAQDIQCLEAPQRTPATRPVKSFYGHPEEGYAMDWSPVSEGR